MELLFVALGMDAYLRSLGSDEDLSDFGTGEVADDVPVLEVMAERFVELEGDRAFRGTRGGQYTGDGSHPHR